MRTDAARRAIGCMALQSWAPRPAGQGVARPPHGSHVVRAMRLLPLCIAGCLLAPAVRAADPGDQINAVQKRPLREARRAEIWAYGSMGIADPSLQRWGGGLRASWHFREGLSLGIDASGLGSWATQELVIAKRELHARVLESHERAAAAPRRRRAPPPPPRGAPRAG